MNKQFKQKNDRLRHYSHMTQATADHCSLRRKHAQSGYRIIGLSSSSTYSSFRCFTVQLHIHKIANTLRQKSNRFCHFPVRYSILQEFRPLADRCTRGHSPLELAAKDTGADEAWMSDCEWLSSVDLDLECQRDDSDKRINNFRTSWRRDETRWFGFA